jgi:hypothetical protein
VDIVAAGGLEGGRGPLGVVGQPYPEAEVVDEQRVDRAGHDLARRQLDHAAAADDGQVEVVLLAGMHEPEAHAGQPTVPAADVGGGPGRVAQPARPWPADPGGRLERRQAKGEEPCSSEPSR